MGFRPSTQRSNSGKCDSPTKIIRKALLSDFVPSAWFPPRLRVLRCDKCGGPQMEFTEHHVNARTAPTDTKRGPHGSIARLTIQAHQAWANGQWFGNFSRQLGGYRACTGAVGENYVRHKVQQVRATEALRAVSGSSIRCGISCGARAMGRTTRVVTPGNGRYRI
jgi:hypothetical protein